MTWMDLAIVIILAAFTLNGLLKGMLRQLANLAGFWAGLILAALLYPLIAARVARPTVGGILLAPMLFVVILLSVWILANLLAFSAQRRARGREDNWSDDLGGALLGFASGVLLLSVLAVAAVNWELPLAPQIKGSRLGRWLLLVAFYEARLLSRWIPLPWRG